MKLDCRSHLKPLQVNWQFLNSTSFPPACIFEAVYFLKFNSTHVQYRTTACCTLTISTVEELQRLVCVNLCLCTHLRLFIVLSKYQPPACNLHSEGETGLSGQAYGFVIQTGRPAKETPTLLLAFWLCLSS